MAPGSTDERGQNAADNNASYYYDFLSRIPLTLNAYARAIVTRACITKNNPSCVLPSPAWVLTLAYIRV